MGKWVIPTPSPMMYSCYCIEKYSLLLSDDKGRKIKLFKKKKKREKKTFKTMVNVFYN